MKKILIPVFAVFCAAFIAACGSDEEEEGERTSPYGTIVDNGELSVLCPYGWYQVDAADLTSESEAVPTNILVFVKGEEGVNLMDSSPYIRIVRFSEEEGIDAPVYGDYDSPKEKITDWSSGRYTWNGFYATTDDHTFTFVQTKADEENYAVWLWMRYGGEEETRITDDDVRRILDSIELSDGG